MTVTTITVIWDRPEHLALHLESLNRQSHRPDQMIVVDNMSEYGNMFRQREIASRYNNCKYILSNGDDKRSRVVEHYLTALQYANTDIVALLDADSIFEYNYISRCVSLMARYENLALSTPSVKLWRWLVVQAQLECDMSLMSMAQCREDGKLDILFRCTLDGEDLSSSDNPIPIPYNFGWDNCIWIRTAHAKEYNVFDPNLVGYGSDRNDIGCALLVNGESLVTVNDIVTYHIEHDKVYTVEDIKEPSIYVNKKWKGIILPKSNPLIPVEVGL